MKRIWKTSIPIGGPITVQLPRRARIVHVGTVTRNAPGIVEFWHEWESTVPGDSQPVTEDRTFQVFATGQSIPHVATYVGTRVVDEPGMMPLVWHVYEIPFG